MKRSSLIIRKIWAIALYCIPTKICIFILFLIYIKKQQKYNHCELTKASQRSYGI